MRDRASIAAAVSVTMTTASLVYAYVTGNLHPGFGGSWPIMLVVFAGASIAALLAPYLWLKRSILRNPVELEIRTRVMPTDERGFAIAGWGNDTFLDPRATTFYTYAFHVAGTTNALETATAKLREMGIAHGDFDVVAMKYGFYFPVGKVPL